MIWNNRDEVRVLQSSAGAQLEHSPIFSTNMSLYLKNKKKFHVSNIVQYHYLMKVPDKCFHIKLYTLKPFEISGSKTGPAWPTYRGSYGLSKALVFNLPVLIWAC